ncbi:Apc13 domain-containing [Fusarium albosuccineum]|uniref:Apc13 domain-containing n=1 Tax=Fusarium albosuccineum TaxID=1237068 RepID=A0A8H4KZU2_9HYPO|nr:Apc13 domain-containing [Fusarium albosuccineum]
MLTTTLFISLAFLVVSSNALGSRHSPRDEAPVVDEFSWDTFTELINIDPGSYLEGVSDDGGDETIACTTKPGPDRLDCPVAMAGWTDLDDDDGNINIGYLRCRSVTYGDCRTVACAPQEELNIALDQITGRMWNPVSARCVFGGTGGIWQNDGSKLVIEMGSPKE